MMVIHESDISIKLLEYQRNWTRITKLKQELLKMGLWNALHVRFVGLILSAVCHNYYVTKIAFGG